MTLKHQVSIDIKKEARISNFFNVRLEKYFFSILQKSHLYRIRIIKETVSCSEQYLLSTFIYNVEYNSSIESHCVTHAVSSEKEKDLTESCQVKHENRCDYCDLLYTFPNQIEELFQDVLNAPGTSNTTVDTTVDEWRFDLEKAVEDITYYKRTVMRAKISQEFWDKQFDRKDPETVLVTSDFAMKLLPRRAREKQEEFFGKKGMNFFG